MSNPFIEYRNRYKYQVASDYSIKTKIKTNKKVDEKFIILDKNGNLKAVEGYAWDDHSGPIVDRTENMSASLVHDALYQLMRHRHLKAKKHKDKANKLFKKICIEDGVSSGNAGIYYFLLKIGGKPATDPKHKKEVHKAQEKKA